MIARASRPPATSATWPIDRRERQRREAGGEAGDERAEGDDLEHDPGDARPGSRPRSPRRRARGRPSWRRRRRRAGGRRRRGARARSTVSAWTSAYRHTRPTARPTPRSTAASTARNAALSVCAAPTGRSRAPRSTRRARHVRRVGAGAEPDDDLRVRGPAEARAAGRAAPSAIRPSCSSARTIPTTRKRTSPPSGTCVASTDPGRSPSASASPTPTSISPGPPIRRPSASGGDSKRV